MDLIVDLPSQHYNRFKQLWLMIKAYVRKDVESSVAMKIFAK